MNILDIHKELHGKGVERFIPKQIYFTTGDLVKLQNYLDKQYTNFNGGFGLHDDSYHIVGSIANDIKFSFTTHLETRSDCAVRAYRDNHDKSYNDKYPYEFNERNCVEYLTWLETIIMLCDSKNIPFRYHPSIIDEIINK